MARLIDVMHLGRDRVIGAWLVDGLVIDPGPESAIGGLLAGLDGEEPRGLLLTHIHLDHAGAAGALVRRFPGLPVYVHERGAPHLADPSRLIASASRLYGDDMERLWGEVLAVPEESIRVLGDGDVVEGFRVAYTPGHASHHVCYLHEATGDAYTGDMTGVRIPPSRYTFAPTPPPDIDVRAWLDSLDVIAAWEPAAVHLTHFGRVEEVGEQIALVREALIGWADAARRLSPGEFTRAFRDQIRSNADEDTLERYLQAAPPDQLYAGLDRYWEKRAA